MRKTIMITGGTGGIGHAIAIAFAKQGNEIIFQGRDAEKGKRIAGELSKINGSTATFIAADVSTIDGIKTFATEVKMLTTKIDVLIHSLGTFNPERRETKDGFYESFTVNYLCKFMLDHLLLEELKTGGGRVIIVGARLMKNAAINFNDLQMRTTYTLSKSRGQNMLAVYMHAQEFSKRNRSIPMNIINPGFVKTGIYRNLKGVMKLFMNVLELIIGNSSEKAIVNILQLAKTESNESGYFYPIVAKPEAKEKINLDASVALKLWDESMILGKLNSFKN
jgi:NAD(P)-dependent dehydrogenase (short-subunit alcohol dehydrogenase family)